MAIATDFELTLEALDDAALEARLDERQPPQEREAALRILVGRSVRRAAPVLRRIVRSAASSAAMRATAANALGRDANPENVPPLIAALADGEDRVVRRAAEALGRIGGETALAALHASRMPSGPALRAHQFAQSLISYRLRLNTNRLASRTPVQQLGPGARPADVAPIPARLRQHLPQWLPEETPGLDPKPEGGAYLDCGGSEYLVLPEQSARDLSGSNAVAAVVLRRSGPVARFALHLYLMTHPAGDRSLVLHGVRPDGTVTHRGTVTRGAAGHRFRLEALETPLAPAMSVEGEWRTAGPALTITRAEVGRHGVTPLWPSVNSGPRSPGSSA